MWLEICFGLADLTHPPLKAPTGFRTGKDATSAASLRDEWKLRAVRKAVEAGVRVACARIRNAIVGCREETLIVTVVNSFVMPNWTGESSVIERAA